MLETTYEDIAGMIDHSLLKPFLTDAEIEAGCRLADSYRVVSVCVRPADVRLAAAILKDSPVKITTVIGFPHGSTTTHAKLEEAKEAITNGAVELDVVLHFGKLKSGEYDYVKNDLEAVIKYAHGKSVRVKVIFENCYLNEEEIIIACEICNELGADWVKTSTGYGTGGAEPKDIQIMRKHAKPSVQVKAAGGVRTLEKLLEMRELGCTRVGATATAQILDEFMKK